MNLELRSRVDDYLKNYSTEPLEFYSTSWNRGKGEYDCVAVEVSDLSIEERGLQQVIINTLHHNLCYTSGINGLIETYGGALRSALDIWRHIKKYNPEITIYEVMKCIADNFDVMNLYSHYCCSIDRRVFRISNDDKYDNDYDEYPAEINDGEGVDEFGLTFYEWSAL